MTKIKVKKRGEVFFNNNLKQNGKINSIALTMIKCMDRYFMATDLIFKNRSIGIYHKTQQWAPWNSIND